MTILTVVSVSPGSAVFFYFILILFAFSFGGDKKYQNGQPGLL